MTIQFGLNTPFSSAILARPHDRRNNITNISTKLFRGPGTKPIIAFYNISIPFGSIQEDAKKNLRKANHPRDFFIDPRGFELVVANDWDLCEGPSIIGDFHEPSEIKYLEGYRIKPIHYEPVRGFGNFQTPERAMPEKAALVFMGESLRPAAKITKDVAGYDLYVKDQVRSFVHQDDLINALVAASQRFEIWREFAKSREEYIRNAIPSIFAD